MQHDNEAGPSRPVVPLPPNPGPGAHRDPELEAQPQNVAGVGALLQQAQAAAEEDDDDAPPHFGLAFGYDLHHAGDGDEEHHTSILSIVIFFLFLALALVTASYPSGSTVALPPSPPPRGHTSPMVAPSPPPPGMCFYEWDTPPTAVRGTCSGDGHSSDDDGYDKAAMNCLCALVRDAAKRCFRWSHRPAD